MTNPYLDRLYNFSLLVLLTYRYIMYTIISSRAERAAGIVAIIPSVLALYIFDAAGEIEMVENKNMSSEQKTRGDIRQNVKPPKSYNSADDVV